MISKGQKSQEITVATDHLELIPWTCSLVAKVHPGILKQLMPLGAVVCVSPPGE